MAFTHLHLHTQYSLLDSTNKVDECVKRIKELGMDSCAITDHGVMYGVINFYKAAKAAGIKPILGCEVYVAPGSRFDRELGAGEDRYYHLILLAENNTGYANLMKIVSRGFTEGYYYKPRVDMETLQEFHEGLICLSACLASEVARDITRGLVDEAKKAALRHLEIFGRGNYFLEMQDHGLSDQQTVNAALIQMSKELDIPLVVTNDVHYTYPEDEKPHDILICLQTGKKLQDENRMRYTGGQYYIKSEEQMRALFPYASEAIENTHKIAERCNVELEFGVTKLPHFEVPEGYTSESYLRFLCEKGLKERYPDSYEAHMERLNYELSTIEQMGYVDYFLIVWDFINYAKENDIAVGPGRGSAAGSIVSYALRITDVDPLKYNLIFERFLNPERVTMPDIDIDFGTDRRSEVISYVEEKYGHDKVVQIITFGTLMAKGVIRDVARVMDLPYSLGDSLAKMVPNQLGITLDGALELSPDLKNAYDEDPVVRELIDMSKRLEGLPRHSGTHAAGVVICQRPADEFVPLARGVDNGVVAQFEKETVEELGLLKMDFLGLRNLNVIQDTCRLVKMSRGIDVDIKNLDYDVKEVYASIGTGKTEGVFQLESAGMRSFMKELQPECLEDIIAGISLYRPGPMDFIPQYIEGKKNREGVTYLTPQLKPILEPTYGCIVYQEQVMQIVRDLGGYTLGRSDLVRRAMAKKKQSVMEKERKNFIYGNEDEGVPGCVSKGIDPKIAEKIFDQMMDFANYAFNKSHAAAYAFVAYQTAYLKYFYPPEFMAALMTSFLDNSAKIASYIASCRSMKIRILPPDVNEGLAGFSVKDGAIVYALSAIKGVGIGIVERIVKERTSRGPFRSLQDFITRMADADINKRLMENFIKAGAFDSLPGNRRQKMSVYIPLMDSLIKDKKNNMEGQMSLFDMVGEEQKKDYEIRFPDVEEYDKETLLSLEKEVIGFYVSGHPLDSYMNLWKRTVTNTTSDFVLEEGDEEGLDGNVKVKDGSSVTVGGIVKSKTIKYTKKNQMMAFVTLEDIMGTVELIVFPRQYERYAQKLTEDAKIFVTGNASVEEDKDAKIILERALSFDEAPKEVWIRFADRAAYEAKEEELTRILKEIPGRDKVMIMLNDVRQVKELGCKVTAVADITERLKVAFGEENIAIR
ncbi:MAG: DNA polymerase III subunit alpha [Lachnospiraceae bacterium]|nr:DNA polymerase III subunit alpha [Lachnospiraceae bacterium]